MATAVSNNFVNRVELQLPDTINDYSWLKEIPRNRTPHGYWPWSEKEAAPYFYESCYLYCAELGSIIDGTLDFMVGTDIVLPPNVDLRVLKQIYRDYLIFNGFCYGIKFDLFGNFKRLVHFPFKNCRINFKPVNTDLFTEEDDFKVYYSRDVRNYTAIEIQESDTNKLFYYADYRDDDYYPKPDFYSVIDPVQSEIQIARFHRSEVTSGFVPSGVLTLPGLPGRDEQMRQKERNINRKFSGSSNAGRLMVVHSGASTTKDNKAVWTPLQQNEMDRRYLEQSNVNSEKIHKAMRAFPQLFAASTNTSSALTETEYAETLSIYMAYKVLPRRKVVDDLLAPYLQIVHTDPVMPFGQKQTTPNEVLLPEDPAVATDEVDAPLVP